MKLAIVRQQYTPFGTAERFIERTMNLRRSRGDDVTIIARRSRGVVPPNLLACNPPYVGRTWRDASFALGVRRLIGNGTFDLVQSHERVPGCHIYRPGDGVHATWLELRNEIRGSAGRFATRLSAWHRYTLATEARLYRHPNLRAVICNSQMVRDDIARRFGVPDDKLHVIYNGVDLEAFHPDLRARHRDWVRADLGIGRDDPVVLFVGSGFERKGLPVLLQAMAQMRERDAWLLVAGQDRNLKKMRTIARRLGLKDRVRFLGGRQDVRAYLGAADCFCLPTLYDPMPGAALEALACGLPVVTSPNCGIAELIEPGRNGYVSSARDATELADYVGRMLGRERPTPETVRASIAHLGVDAMAARLAALYDKLLEDTPDTH